MSSADSKIAMLLTGDQLERWEAEARHHEARADALEADARGYRERADKLRTAVQMARNLAALLEDSQSPTDVAVEGLSSPAPTAHLSSPLLPSGTYSGYLSPPPLRKGTWPEVLRDWIYSRADGLSSIELKRLIHNSPEWSAKYKESNKGYYHAISRLAERGIIVKHRDRYFAPKLLHDYVARVRRGEAPDIQPARPASSRSPMGEAVLDIVHANPGILGKEIVARLRSDSEFNASLSTRDSGAYNVIARLERRGQIARRGSACFPGPAMPPRDPRSRWIPSQTDLDHQLDLQPQATGGSE